jgi:signal transduction histidine kinase
VPYGQRSWPLRGLDRLPIRWRLAVVSAALTGVILLLFAVAVGSFTTRRIEDDFSTQTAARFGTILDQLDIRAGGRLGVEVKNDLDDLAGESGTVIAVWGRASRGYTLLGSSNPEVDIGRPTSTQTRFGDLRVSTRQFDVPLRDANGKPDTTVPVRTNFLDGTEPSVFNLSNPRLRNTVPVVVRLARSYDATERTTRRVWTALALGVFGGSALALMAGLALGTRAMRPVRRMTGTARHIARTRDLDAKMPTSRVHDEIAELSGTLQDMLDELAAAQATVDATLQAQREFIADASHELRTPLTSVQANLELLALSTSGDDREAAESALRSSRRMRRLVADLLLLARMDASRESAREPVDLDSAVLEAVDELEPQFGGHEIVLDLEPVTVDGIRDELVRMVANLVGNALRHTPEGTEIRVRLKADGARGELVVEDDGPGVPADLRDRIFDRFVRRGGEGAGSTGIGLAIVRAAAQRHGGDVRVEATDPERDRGARFVVWVRATADADEGAETPDAEAPPDADDDVPRGEAPAGPSRRVGRRIRRRLAPRRAADDAGTPDRLGGAGPSDD